MATTKSVTSTTSNDYMLHQAQMQIASLKENKSYTISVGTTPIYRINVTALNIVADSSNPTAIKLNGTVTLRYTADGINYIVPAKMPTITGATGTYNRVSDTECTITLSNPTSNVSFTMVGKELFIGLCFTANTAGSTVELCRVGSPNIANTAYSFDCINWTTFDPGTKMRTNTVTLTNAGDKVYFRNDITSNFSSSDYLYFSMTGSISASGNVNSIYSSTNYKSLTTLTYNYCYYELFSSCTSLTTAPELPATTLASYCYSYMFNGCASLTTAPVLLATTLSDCCYIRMFEGCTSLTIPPELPVVTLKAGCYQNMFSGCTSLTTAPELPATTLATTCYFSMFYNCTSLTTAPALPATTLANSCYMNMFNGCTALTTIPALPATALTNSCYNGMFKGCTSLYISDTQTSEASYEWKIPSSGTFADTHSQSDMFVNCLGTRSSDTMPGASGNSYTYYTQNRPV